MANNEVTSLVHAGGTLYLVGLFDVVGPYTGTSARIDPNTGLVDFSFPKVEGTVNTVVPDGNGGWYVGGAITRVGGVTRNGLAHILADGRVSSWDPNPNGSVTAIVLSGRKIYVAGGFTTIGGQARNRLAVVDAVTGLADGFNPSVGPSPLDLLLVGNTLYITGAFTTVGGQTRNRAAAVDATTGAVLPFNPDVGSSVVADIAVYGNTVFLGGQFLTVGGQSRGALAAVDAVSGALQTWNPNPFNAVQSLRVAGNTLYVGGGFSTIAGQSRSRLAAFDLPGLTLTAWNPNVTGQYVTAIDVAGSTVYVGGPFTAVGGVERSRLAAIDVASGVLLPWDPVADGSIEKLIVSDGHVYVGGLAVSVNGKVRRLAAALDAATGVANSWNPRGTNLVSALAVSGSAVFLGGQFTSAGGQPRADIAALDPVTGDALPWNPGATMSVDALAVVGNTLYAGGQFTTIGGQLRDRIAALNATDGTVLAWNPGSTSTVTELATDGTTLYAGSTTTIAGQTRNGLAAFDVATGNLLPWDPNLTGGAVATIAVRGATVLAGGDFTNVNVQTRNRAVAIDTNGSPTAWDPSPPAGSSTPTVRGLTDAGDRILAAGTFTTIGGAARSYLAALDPATGADLGWSPTPNGFADAVAASGNFVYAAGMFTTIGGNPRRGVAAFCRAPAPTALAPTPGANLVDLAWSPTGAAEYRVYRALAATGPFQLIGTSATPAYTDLTVEGGVTYYYRVSAFDGCESPFSNAVSTTPSGSCQLPPVFEGLAWAEQGTGSTCSVSLGWTPATAPCGGAVFYSVYRNTSPSFAPSSANLVATSVTGLGYTDATPLAPDTTYYYAVRATSLATGMEDANLFRYAATPTACSAGAPGMVEGLTVTSRSGQNVLQWINPPGFGTVRIRYKSGPTCASPTDPLSGGTFLADDTGLPTEARRFPHTGVTDGTEYCYGLFVDTGGGTWSGVQTSSGRPPLPGPVQWAFNSGLFSTTPPTVGGAGVIATNNDSAVHAMSRGTAGGEWPSGWRPVKLGGIVQGRSPVVPVTVNGVNPVVFLGAQDGKIYAVDGTKGAAGSPPWAGPVSIAGMVQAAPAGIFIALGSTPGFDYLLVGTRDDGADNAFVVLDPVTGSELGRYGPAVDPDRIGIVSGAASVDYATNRVYFTSWRRSPASAKSLWCLQLGVTPDPVVTIAWARDDLGDILSSPVIRGGRLYVGSTAAGGTLHSIDLANPTAPFDRTFVHGDGQVKDFVFPDRVSPGGELYFATTDRVWVVRDDGSTLTPKYLGGIALGGTVTPSTALYVPGSGFVYVGGSDGQLYEIDVSGATPSVKPLPLGDGTALVGAPSYDRETGLLHVGTAAGVFYAVQVPLP